MLEQLSLSTPPTPCDNNQLGGSARRTPSPAPGRNHRTIQVGKDLQDHRVQPSPQGPRLAGALVSARLPPRRSAAGAGLDMEGPDTALWGRGGRELCPPESARPAHRHPAPRPPLGPHLAGLSPRRGIAPQAFHPRLLERCPQRQRCFADGCPSHGCSSKFSQILEAGKTARLPRARQRRVRMQTRARRRARSGSAPAVSRVLGGGYGCARRASTALTAGKPQTR